MLIIAAGMQKAGTAFAYNVLNGLLVAAAGGTRARSSAGAAWIG